MNTAYLHPVCRFLALPCALLLAATWWVDAAQVDLLPPTTPTALTVTAVTDRSVSLTWGASQDDCDAAAAIVYGIFIGDDRPGGASPQPRALAEGGLTTCSVTGLEPETEYRFCVAARDTFGHWSEASAVVTASTPPAPASAADLAALSERLGELEGVIEGLRQAERQTDTQASLLTLGRDIYRGHCLRCHGSNGDGKGPGARGLITKPWDFTLGQYKWRTTVSGAIPRDSDLYRTISEGLPGTRMPAWRGLLTPRERMAAVQYIKGFSPRFANEPLEEDDLLAIPDQAPPATSADIAKGAEVFQANKCWECHGQTGGGDGPNAPNLKDDRDLPIRPTNFNRGVYKGGDEDVDLYRTIITGLSGTPMPSYNGLIAPEDVWALVRYIQSLKREPHWWESIIGEPLDE